MTRFPHRSLFALCALLATPATVVAAGPGAIEGVVVDARGAPLPAGVKVTITCGAVTKTATVDRGGGFSVTGLPAGSCTVTGQGAGFAATAVTVTVSDDATASVMLAMRPPAPPPEALEFAEAAAPAVAMAGAGGAPRPPMVAPAPMRRAEAKPADPMADAPRPPPPPPRIVRLDAADAKAGKLANLRMKDEAFDGVRVDALQVDQPFAGEFAPVRVFPVPQYTAGYVLRGCLLRVWIYL